MNSTATVSPVSPQRVGQSASGPAPAPCSQSAPTRRLAYPYLEPIDITEALLHAASLAEDETIELTG